MRVPFASISPQYWRVWTASAFSNLSDGVYLVAAPLLAASLTRDPVLVAGVSFAFGLPWLLFPLVSGALVDRLDRRVILGVGNIFRAALIGMLGLFVMFGWESLPLLYVVFFLLGSVETMYDNAAQAIIPAVAGRENLEKANGRLYAVELVNNQFVGPPLRGFLFGVAAAIPFLFGAGAFAAASAMVLSLRGSFRSVKEEGAPPTTLVSEIGEGLRWLWGHRLLRLLAVMLGASTMSFSAVFGIMVLFAQDILGLGGFGYGLLLTSIAVGGVIGSFTSERVIGFFGSGRALFLCVVAEVIVFMILASTVNPFLAGAMLAVIGFIMVVWNVITVSLRQAIIPEHLFGRVNSVYRMLGWGGIPLGALLGGLLARTFGLTAPMWTAVAILLFVAAITWMYIGNDAIERARIEA
ncbi:MAG: MFS transporter [Rubrobacter sp.]|nr:MFS transporter [Rubrobacter sp.]